MRNFIYNKMKITSSSDIPRNFKQTVVTETFFNCLEKYHAIWLTTPRSTGRSTLIDATLKYLSVVENNFRATVYSTTQARALVDAGRIANLKTDDVMFNNTASDWSEYIDHKVGFECILNEHHNFDKYTVIQDAEYNPSTLNILEDFFSNKLNENKYLIIEGSVNKNFDFDSVFNKYQDKIAFIKIPVEDIYEQDTIEYLKSVMPEDVYQREMMLNRNPIVKEDDNNNGED